VAAENNDSCFQIGVIFNLLSRLSLPFDPRARSCSQIPHECPIIFFGKYGSSKYFISSSVNVFPRTSTASSKRLRLLKPQIGIVPFWMIHVSIFGTLEHRVALHAFLSLGDVRSGGPGQQATVEGCPGDEADTGFGAEGIHFAFFFAVAERVVVLGLSN
jgi:hypothetical protein